MDRRKISLTVIPGAAILLAALAPGAAPATAEHQIIVELELEGDACPAALVIVSAQGCDTGELAEDLCAELVDKGLSAESCSPDSDHKVCAWSIPPTCTELRNRMTLESGPDCGDDSLEAKFRLVESGLGSQCYAGVATIIGADAVRLVEVKIELPADT